MHKHKNTLRKIAHNANMICIWVDFFTEHLISSVSSLYGNEETKLTSSKENIYIFALKQ